MLDNLKSLLEDQIKDLYSAENQLVKALPKMAKAATSPALREAFEGHLVETKGHVQRLSQIAEALGISSGGKKCKAMEGLVAEGDEVLEEKGDESVIDAALIAAAQRVEHYEMSAYGTARELAKKLQQSDVVELLQATLEEEKSADEKLNEISLDEILPVAPLGDDSDSDRKSSKPSAATAKKKDAGAKSATRNTERGVRSNGK
ncbi:MAG: ferritin-like domain-containing protein [Phycisphaerales bacterium]